MEEADRRGKLEEDCKIEEDCVRAAGVFAESSVAPGEATTGAWRCVAELLSPSCCVRVCVCVRVCLWDCESFTAAVCRSRPMARPDCDWQRMTSTSIISRKTCRRWATVHIRITLLALILTSGFQLALCY